MSDPRDSDTDKDSDDRESGSYVPDMSGGVQRSDRDAIEANLGREEGWGTGAGCSQDEENIPD